MKSELKVTIIMRTRNSGWVIDQALTSLFSQNYNDFKLLVVDSGSTDNTLEIIKKFPCDLIEIKPEEYYPGPVLNMAAEACDGELLVFQNSDVVLLHEDVLGRLVAAFEDPLVSAAFARQIPRPEAHGWVRRDYEVSFPDSGPAPPWITLSLPFAAILRSAWEDRKFYKQAWASEDTEWGVRALADGLTIRYVHDATVMHSHNYSLHQIYGRLFVEGEADAFIYGDKVRLFSQLKRYVGANVNDFIYHAKRGNFGDLFFTPVRRAVYQWAYTRGHRHGEARIRSGSEDRRTGQAKVLKRYDG